MYFIESYKSKLETKGILDRTGKCNKSFITARLGFL